MSALAVIGLTVAAALVGSAIFLYIRRDFSERWGSTIFRAYWPIFVVALFWAALVACVAVTAYHWVEGTHTPWGIVIPDIFILCGAIWMAFAFIGMKVWGWIEPIFDRTLGRIMDYLNGRSVRRRLGRDAARRARAEWDQSHRR